jgi:hypothetical protein
MDQDDHHQARHGEGHGGSQSNRSSPRLADDFLREPSQRPMCGITGLSTMAIRLSGRWTEDMEPG